MKKHLLLSAFVILGLLSCANEGNAVNTLENMKTPEMQALDKAFKSLGDPKNRATEEEKRSGSTELSDRRKELLVPASKALILSTGVSEKEMITKTGGDITKIIVWAVEINLKKKDEIRKNLGQN
ncbi:hypothetical protein ACM39_11045 [Chryseobacterium sp. FH2]|uniref:hypothetical protein n=1 Tax=Chryseobacterium sp. FH2 TaxID=1674291 RepID=UPI00065ACA12|nr:hypothetical protein [Chryseobacterium sp. FH2]KMQ67870.1 hypothetical protein ACM39_11045 [Chryseobacterium sp. FH2]